MVAIAVLKTMAEVSEMTGIPVNTLRYYRHLGTKGPRSALLGSRIMYREQDVIDWINEQFEASDAK
ncbi:helix-turn-helix domain-containing protein [Glutamicibacter sp. FBE19]|uniref:helix-turn-helix transcriptional regulator n=1 Tax=Glutamicibacter sp. FBE19 TaxID=2761534 RepID=UPI00189693A7|nr:helix-turn-helix domain-containing protein [Glutamicibacter sp. FBE19]MBF6672425.1 helix-turn-helix domain-containing protein [Glutamicibacter sp. FBE19]